MIAQLKVEREEGRSPERVARWRKEVEVECGDGARVTALTYFLIKPEEKDKRPSGVYKDVIVRGAEEHGIPSYYLAKLRNVEDNSYMGEVSVNVDLRKISKVPDD